MRKDFSLNGETYGTEKPLGQLKGILEAGNMNILKMGP